MARSKSSSLAVKRNRLDLPISKKPVFESLGDGVSVGYRRNLAAGTWIARRADGKGGSWQKVIGTADDFADADGIRILSWAQAQIRTFDEAKLLGPSSESDHGPARPACTVAIALEDYEQDLQVRGGDTGNIKRARLHIVGDLLNKHVVELTPAELRKWRDCLTKKLAPATVNRTATIFKAALNFAANHDERIFSRNAWEKGLISIPDADEARNVILSDDQVRKIVGAAYRQSLEFGLLVETAAVTGARYGQIAGLLVGDLQKLASDSRLMMPSSKKGKGVKRILRRPIPIPNSLAEKLCTFASHRAPSEPLLLKPLLEPATRDRLDEAPTPDAWRKSDHYRPFKRAVADALRRDEGLTEEPITIYALRHSSIVRQILHGIPVRVVAVMHDTSVQMIEKNYSTKLADFSDSLARAALLQINETISAKENEAAHD